MKYSSKSEQSVPQEELMKVCYSHYIAHIRIEESLNKFIRIQFVMILIHNHEYKSIFFSMTTFNIIRIEECFEFFTNPVLSQTDFRFELHENLNQLMEITRRIAKGAQLFNQFPEYTPAYHVSLYNKSALIRVVRFPPIFFRGALH